jgi:hypothetical protein
MKITALISPLESNNASKACGVAGVGSTRIAFHALTGGCEAVEGSAAADAALRLLRLLLLLPLPLRCFLLPEDFESSVVACE